jgi:hypothetical protein
MPKNEDVQIEVGGKPTMFISTSVKCSAGNVVPNLLLFAMVALAAKIL